MEFSFEKVATFAKGDGAVNLPDRIATPEEVERALAKRDRLRQPRELTTQPWPSLREAAGDALNTKTREQMATAPGLSYGQAAELVRGDPRNAPLVRAYAGAAPPETTAQYADRLRIRAQAADLEARARREAEANGEPFMQALYRLSAADQVA